MVCTSFRRVTIFAQHLVPAQVSADGDDLAGVPGKTLPKLDVLQEFVQDPEWANKPFWMLNVLNFKDEGKYIEYGQMMAETFGKIGARLIFSGHARTVIGRNTYHRVAIVEYPSPRAFFEMATSPEMGKKNQTRLQGLREQYLIPLRPGWFHLDRRAPPASKPIHFFDADSAWSTPNGMIGAAAAGARVGETSSTFAQTTAFIADEKLTPPAGPLWHLNLLKFTAQGGRETYGEYAKAMGGKNGVLSLFGGRSTLSAQCYKSLIGDTDFEQAIIAEYPTRDHFLSMGASEEYMKTAQFRHRGLDETYIVSCLPEFVNKAPLREA
eukprot:TRINITY_DN33029_c0_g1_i1.p1 TRINITY_DN33029_c0_g1~~TRINITY_DN33029_c0_g1_i1.p1  ORF type:complete len:350 (-),score=35.10 TRINITY_DN33029_c0_g1_i1:150-1121(-)